ncbi:hypothetical protein E05_18870 [Plautia stali symbiont]|nr:hypothetical protein E05_18870 [Plautia stali symbiont]
MLQAHTRFGAMRGMETLLQLIANTASGKQIPFVTIDDRPRFPWRGVLIDPVRHFLPLETLKRQIDGIAAARMNVFHWHLTDDQGWRFASSHYPQLQLQASDGLFYSQQQMRELVHLCYPARRVRGAGNRSARPCFRPSRGDVGADERAGAVCHGARLGGV